MTREEDVQWSDEAVARSFREEIHRRFEEHNKAFRVRDAADLEEVLRQHPGRRGEPGFEVRDSGAWRVYQESEIRIEQNTVTVVLPCHYAVGMDLVHLFDHTTVAWGRPTIGAMVVEGEPRPTIEIVLVATWTDEMDAAWRAEGSDRRRVQVELFEDDVHELIALVEHKGTDLKIADRLRLSLEVLP